jgi:hypothetical protein
MLTDPLPQRPRLQGLRIDVTALARTDPEEESI